MLRSNDSLTDYGRWQRADYLLRPFRRPPDELEAAVEGCCANVVTAVIERCKGQDILDLLAADEDEWIVATLRFVCTVLRRGRGLREVAGMLEEWVATGLVERINGIDGEDAQIVRDVMGSLLNIVM
jgi:hypothetical protein